MAWTTPLTAVANVILTAAQWNASVRDNLAETGPANATTAGRLIVTDAANSVTERDVVTATVATAETTVSTGYVDLATVGPSVTVTTGTKGLVSVGCLMSNSTGGLNDRGWMSHNISGASTAAASDTYALVLTSSAANDTYGGSHVSLWTTLTPGSSTFKGIYRASGGTQAFSQRRIIVMAL